MQSNANTKPIGGEDLKILDIIHSLENPRLRLGFFQTTHDIENFKIFSTNGFNIVSFHMAASPLHSEINSLFFLFTFA